MSLPVSMTCAREGIVLTRDMVSHDGDVYDDHWHGRSVLSCMAGILPGYLQGTAPLADYALLRTEEVAYELVIEEDNWVAGAEVLDSLGADVLNTSLGYTTFDDPSHDHSYADMDGATSRMSIAAGIASRKGMIPVQSAGNSGSSAWHYIGAAADAIDILAVGAVGDQGQHAPFSSWGPSSDGRVKPDVMALGWGAVGLRVQGDSAGYLNGTSFSSPILAGLVACLWQLHPQRNSHDVMDAVRRSAHLWSAPNDSMGYGIPDFMQAHAWLTATSVENLERAVPLYAYPNPFAERVNLHAPGMKDGPARLQVLDASGRVALERNVFITGGSVRVNQLDGVPSGLWLFRLNADGVTRTVRALKP
ncbi:MAG: S8 family serine peptidase [Flavobacteriales bacterium]|nr:S8 family serine peptidase [Flavobacteriales bacterium]